MGNYVACKNYTQKEKNLFIHLTRSHFSLIAKTYDAIGTCCLFFFFNFDHAKFTSKKVAIYVKLHCLRSATEIDQNLQLF